MVQRSFLKVLENILEWISRHLPDCEKTTFDISRSFDGRRGFRRSFMMKLHLLTCGACRNYLKQLTFIRTAIRGYTSDLADRSDPPACDLSVEARERIIQALRVAL